MAPADFTTLLRIRPFQPFRVISSDGTAYEVRHPDLVLTSTRSVVIGYPSPDDPLVAMRYDIVSLFHVLRIETIEEPSTPKGNGEAGQGNPG